MQLKSYFCRVLRDHQLFTMICNAKESFLMKIIDCSKFAMYNKSIKCSIRPAAARVKIYLYLFIYFA